MARRVGSVAFALWVGGCASLFGVDELRYQDAVGDMGGDGGAAAPSAGGGGFGGVPATTTTTGTGGQGGMAVIPPPLDCLDALESGRSIGDGIYTVDPDGELGSEAPFEVYCDMTSAGGGWTLVYAYTFTNYPNFDSNGNAVTPRPSWPLNVGDSVPVSTTTPLSLSDYNAMDFARWVDFGTEVLAVSNLTNWIRCTPGDGSLVENISGSVNCEVVMNVVQYCPNVAPNEFIDSNSGGCRPALQVAGGTYRCFDGRINNNWPTHDACGSNFTSQVEDLANPQGAILVRRLPPP